MNKITDCRNVLLCGDILKTVGMILSGSVDLTVTSPPYYNAKEYSQYPSYEAYLRFLHDVFLETYRITKEGRHLIINTSPVIEGRLSRQHSSKRYPIPFDLNDVLQSIGWEFQEDIFWVKPEPSAKNRNANFSKNRKPLAYRPNLVVEYVVVYRKKTDRVIDWNMKMYSREVIAESLVSGDYPTTNVWEIPPESSKEHPAVYPKKLCELMVGLYSYKKDVVFDPFGGRGTTGMVSSSLERYYLLGEKNNQYIQTICRNLGTTSIFMRDKPLRVISPENYIFDI